MENTKYKRIQDYLISIFEQRGFVAERNQDISDIDNFIIQFKKTNDLKKDLVHVSVQSDSKRHNLVILFIARKRINDVEIYINNKRRKLLQDSRGENYTIQTFSGFLEDIRLIPISEIQKDIELFLDRIQKFVESIVLKSLTRYKTIHHLEAAVNKEINNAKPLWGNVFWIQKIIISKLSDSGNYEMLFKYIMEMHMKCLEQEVDNNEKEYYQNCVDVLLELRAELQNVQPYNIVLN
ncbi:hypothetical protein [Flagellimonas eckloniae]|uniref:Uncharacterized protein n=1 Tax=Flagellimonas eckloniae TaxID=346185 RepID=A0A0N8WGH2_9FLAO|nr:hypothetical protein [Allomuricauda eckloniae]KQC31491.1 hypothetical protein AAY42_17640 [Allomuricauda eckloniae]